MPCALLASPSIAPSVCLPLVWPFLRLAFLSVKLLPYSAMSVILNRCKNPTSSLPMRYFASTLHVTLLNVYCVGKA